MKLPTRTDSNPLCVCKNSYEMSAGTDVVRVNAMYDGRRATSVRSENANAEMFVRAAQNLSR